MKCSFSYNSFVKFHGTIFGSHTMTMLKPNQCYNEVCYKGTALYFFSMFIETQVILGRGQM